MIRTLKTTLLPLVALAFLLSGCGERHEARSLAQDFMEEHMPMQDYEVVRWSRLDSTFFVTPVALKAMHAEAEHSRIVMHCVNYQGYTPKLLFMHGWFAHDRDTVSRTFYFDDKLQGIVGVKRN